MMNGFHHSDTELPAAKNDISVESVFGAKAVGRDPRHVTDVPKNASSQSIPAVFHDEEFGTETPIQYERKRHSEGEHHLMQGLEPAEFLKKNIKII